MGVAYSHGMFVRDLDWRPQWKHVAAIVDVLRRWGFGDDVRYVTGGDEIDEDEARTMPNNLLVVVAGPEGDSAAKIMGASIYDDVQDEDRYVIDAQLHVGSAFKVLASIEGEEVEVTTPPIENGEPLEPREEDVEYPNIAYDASWTAAPPVTDAGGDFSRVWRCGLILDCDKDVPAIAETRAGIPSKRFIRDLEVAFGTKLVEVGWHH